MQEENYRQAISYHEKCLSASQEAHDRASEGLAGYRIGRAYVLLEEADRAIGYLDDYHAICRELQDLEGEGAASSSLAAAYQSLDSVDNAVQYLEQFLEVATKTDNLIAQGEACCNLGVIFNKRGDFAKAVEFFEKNFEIARSTVVSGKGDRSLVDTARVNLGMARGNEKIQAYMNIINYDLTTLLRWKNRRVKFEG
jgi:tetratricopeptide (TPR) repeat protein